MKKILFLLMAMVPMLCFGQIFIPDGKYGTQHIRSQKDSVDIIPKGLTGSNNGKRTNIFGKDTAQIRYNVGDSSIYYHTGSQWLKLTGGIGGGGGVDSVTFSPSQNVDTVKYWIAGTGYVAGVVDVKCGLISPGTVVHDSLLSFTVSPSIHRSCEDGVRYTTSLTHLTLSAADGTFDRYDIIALEGDDVVVVEGDPSATPVLPQLTTAQTMLTFISIPATATVPSGPFTTIIYDENTEFTGSASGVTVDFGNFTDPYHLVKATSTGAVTSASTISYTGSDFKISSYHTLRFFIKLKAAFANNTRFQLSWLRDGVTQSGTVALQNNTYGFLRAAGGYQEIIIPISDFGPFLTDSVDAFKIQLTGSNGSGFYIDYIQIQGGISQAPTGTTRDRFGVSGEDATATQNRNFNGRNLYFFNLDSIASFALTATSTAFKNISGSNWLSYSASAMAINPLSTGIPLTFSNIPASDTAMYVLGVNAAGRAVLQLKSAISGASKFGKSGEDATMAEDRAAEFSSTYDFSINHGRIVQMKADSTTGLGFSRVNLSKISYRSAIGTYTTSVPGMSAYFSSNWNSGKPYAQIAATQTNNSGDESYFRMYQDSAVINLNNNVTPTIPLYIRGISSATGTKALRIDATGKITSADTTAGGGGGYTTLAQFVSETNWTTGYINGSGDYTELPLGTSGKVLTSNGASSAPSWETPGGASYTFSNGINESGGAAKLGGAITQYTDFHDAGNEFVEWYAGAGDASLIGWGEGQLYVYEQRAGESAFSNLEVISGVDSSDSYVRIVSSAVNDGAYGQVTIRDQQVGIMGSLFIGGNSVTQLTYNSNGGGRSMGNTLVMFDARSGSQLPTSSEPAAIIMYADMAVGGQTELKVRDEQGNVTTLSPHNFTGIPQGKSEDMAWAFYSEKDGKYINVDMLKLARLLEKLTGEKLIYTGEIKK